MPQILSNFLGHVHSAVDFYYYNRTDFKSDSQTCLSVHGFFIPFLQMDPGPSIFEGTNSPFSFTQLEVSQK